MESRANFQLTPKQRNDARSAIRILEGTGISLSEAAQRCVHNGRNVASVTFDEAVARFLKSRDEEHCRNTTLRFYDQNLMKAVEHFGSKMLTSIAARDIREFIASKKNLSESSRASCARCIRVMWRWAMNQDPQLVGHDATIGLKTKAPPRTADVDFLTVEEARSIMTNVHERYRSAFALMLFAGIRPHEIYSLEKEEKLRWSHIDTQARIIRIPASIAKTGMSRILEGLPDALWRHLSPGDPNSTVSPASADPTLVRAARKLISRPWPHDATRHSFATYAVALTSDPGKVSLWLGHVGNPYMLHTSYRGLTTKQRAEEYFSI